MADTRPLPIPPHSVAAEQSLLGSLLISQAACAKLSRTLKPGDFYRPDHQKIYAAIESLRTDGKPVDAVTVSDYLERTGAIGDTGGLGYIGGLVRDTPSADNVETYAAVVRERAMLRQLNAFGEGVIRASTVPSEQSAAELLAKAQHQLTVMQSKSATLADRAPMARIINAAAIKPEPISWLWDGWLAAGKLHILAGAPGTGKTTVAMAWAATISRGGVWPDRTKAQAGDVLIWSAEDAPDDVLVPRLHAMEANVDRIGFIDQAEVGDKVKPFDPATDMAQLHAYIKAGGPRPRLLIIDPIVSAVSGDSHKGSETRRSLQPLVDFGATHGCAIVGISHFSKGTAGRDVLERVTGSIAFGALARLVFAAAKLPDDQGGGRFIARAKSNIGVDGGGFKYELRQCNLPSDPTVSTSALLWGESIEGSARDILATAEVSEDSDDKSQASEAVEWLGDLLSSGPIDSKEASKKAKAFGISDKSLRTARTRLKVKPQKIGYGANGRWVWELPTDEDAHEGIKGALDAHTQGEGALGIFDTKGHLNKGDGAVADDVEGL